MKTARARLEHWPMWGAGILLAAIAMASCTSASSAAGGRPEARRRTSPDAGQVRRQVDGDTLDIDPVGRVRLIGVDTPETKDPRKPVQCFGFEAAAYLARLLPIGAAVRVVYDIDRHDGYGRSLAYLYRAEDNLFVNAELVRAGYAQVLTVPPNVAHAAEFVTLEREARTAGRGLWSACAAPRSYLAS